MTGLYAFAAAVGVPLAIWLLLSGGDDGAETDGGGEGLGGVMLRFLPLSTFALVAATFGVAGLALQATGEGAATSFVWAVVVGVVVGALNSTAFAYLRRSESGASTGDDHLVGSMGRVVVPVGEARRGRVSVAVDGQIRYLSARAVPDGAGSVELEVGARVLLIEISNGIASVTRLDPELSD